MLTRRRAVITAVLAVAAGLLVWSATLNAGDEEVALTESAVEAVTPTNGATLVLRQSEVSADLATGWTGVLQIDGVEIPQDQLRQDTGGLNLLSFAPGPGKEIEELDAGTHVATVLIWQEPAETRDDARSVSWRFTVA